MKTRKRRLTRDESRHAVDITVGARIRLRRTLLGMSQEKLGAAIGLTFQQVQKYERAANRVSAGLLATLSRVLDVPIAYFFEDALAEPAGDREEDRVMMRRETLELVRAYYAIPVSERAALRGLVKAMAQNQPVKEALGA